jgi:rhodanese-related sulfurtransferase
MNFLSPSDILEGNAPENAQYVDVREPAELAQAKWPLFQNLPLSTFESTFAQLDKNRPVVVICAAGMRSLKAGTFLQNQGFESVWNVDGGMNAAAAEGAPLE